MRRVRPVFRHLSTRAGAAPPGGTASHTTGPHTMEAERLNQISDQIDDLRARTDALRGYL